MTLRTALVCVSVFFISGLVWPQIIGAQDKIPSPKIQKLLIERVVEEIQSGDHGALVKSVRHLLRTNNAQKFDELNKWFIALGNPSLDRALLDARLAANNIETELPKVNVDEMLLIAPVLQSDVKLHLKEIQQLELFQDPLASPHNFQEFESMLWDANQTANLISGLLENLELSQSWHEQIQRDVKRNKKLSPPQIQLLDPAWSANMLGQFKAIQRDLFERLAEVRYFRMEDSVAKMRTSAIRLDQLRAALLIQRDDRFLRQLIAELNNQFLRPNLKDGLLKENIDQLVAEAKSIGKDFLQKARHLDEGIYWWLRGRYGFARQAGGLLKMPRAAEDERAQQAIFMPDQRPIPTSPTTVSNDGESVPYYRRRHLYNWAVEYRPKYDRSRVGNKTDYSRTVSRNMLPEPEVTSRVLNCGGHQYTEIRKVYGTETVKTTSRTTSQQVNISMMAPKDRTMYSRLVGTYEYTRALDALDQFVSMAEPADLEAANRIVESMPELDLFTNLSRFIEPDDAILRQRSDRPNDDFRRRGLDWIMAFARLELASNLSAYSEISDPFIFVKPTEFELPAFADLVFDALRTHYYTLSQDNFFKFIMVRDMNSADNDTAAYVRRLNLLVELLKTSAYFYFEGMNQSQQQELAEWKNIVDQSREYLQAILPEGLTIRGTLPIQHEPISKSKTRKIQNVTNHTHR